VRENWNESGTGLRVARRRRWRTTAGDGEEGDGDATAPPLRSRLRLIRFSRLAAPALGWALVGYHRKRSGPLAQIDEKLCPSC
jgi:hypothetical protein